MASTHSTTPSTTLSTSSSTPLPAILCLHGGGSTSTVFKIQLRRLIWSLNRQFRFVFAQAPIEGAPGMGMIPVFQSCAPFYRWVSRKFRAGEDGVEATPREETEAVDAVLQRAMDENGGMDAFVGVIGFSQGARLVAGLLLRQMIEVRDQGESKWKFKFGAIIGGPFPPISLSESVDPKDYGLLRQIPTVHAWGREDPVIEGAKEMARACESEHCFRMDFAGGHHLPLTDNEARDLCDLIMAAWYAGGGTYGVGTEETY